MSMTAAQVEEALLALDASERAAVIHRGLQSLGSEDVSASQSEIDEAWRAELRHRIAEVESGRVELMDVAESHAQLRTELFRGRR